MAGLSLASSRCCWDLPPSSCSKSIDSVYQLLRVLTATEMKTVMWLLDSCIFPFLVMMSCFYRCVTCTLRCSMLLWCCELNSFELTYFELTSLELAYFELTCFELTSLELATLELNSFELTYLNWPLLNLHVLNWLFNWTLLNWPILNCVCWTCLFWSVNDLWLLSMIWVDATIIWCPVPCYYGAIESLDYIRLSPIWMMINQLFIALFQLLWISMIVFRLWGGPSSSSSIHKGSSADLGQME